jgi:phosphomannomutase
LSRHTTVWSNDPIAVLAGLLAAGCEVVDLGICPTPSMQLAIKSLKADGGIAITAGSQSMAVERAEVCS